MSIVVASDLSDGSRAALGRAAALAKALSLPLHVVHAVDPNLPETVRRAAEQGAADILARECRTCGVEAAVAAVAGRAKAEIARYALDVGAGLVVVGRHDTTKDGLFRFADTTAGQIVRASPIPVLLVSNASVAPYATAVVGIDFSIYARAALRHAKRIAPEARLHLVHAYQVPYRMHLGPPDLLADLAATAKREFDQFLAEDMAQLIARSALSRSDPARLTHESIEGAPYAVLTRTVERLKADLLVVGTHGAGAVVRAVWGSVATALLEEPPCDLLIVHEV